MSAKRRLQSGRHDVPLVGASGRARTCKAGAATPAVKPDEKIAAPEARASISSEICGVEGRISYHKISQNDVAELVSELGSTLF